MKQGLNNKKKEGSIMPRKARKDLETGFFHVMVQGIKKEKIFYNNKYKEKYIYLMKFF